MDTEAGTVSCPPAFLSENAVLFRLKMQFFPAFRVGEGETVALQGNSSFSSGTVLSVAEKGKAVCGELGTNLMKTTGFQGNLEEKLPVPLFQNLVVKGSFFYPFSWFLLFQALFADCILRRNQDAITLL